jgi:hypothetical protein
MDEASIVRYLTETLADLEILEQAGTYYFYADADRKMPLATLVTNDDHDQASNLSRPGVYRLNIGVKKPTFLALFGAQPSPPGPSGTIEWDCDFAALDVLMPHPVYGNMCWLCVLNPSEQTFERVKPLLDEAHEMYVGRREKRAGRE